MFAYRAPDATGCSHTENKFKGSIRQGNRTKKIKLRTDFIPIHVLCYGICIQKGLLEYQIVRKWL